MELVLVVAADYIEKNPECQYQEIVDYLKFLGIKTKNETEFCRNSLIFLMNYNGFKNNFHRKNISTNFGNWYIPKEVVEMKKSISIHNRVMKN